MTSSEREKFIQDAITLMAMHPQDEILILISGPGGMKHMQTVPSVVWTFGMLATAEKVMDERFRAVLQDEAARSLETERQMNVAMSAEGVKN